MKDLESKTTTLNTRDKIIQEKNIQYANKQITLYAQGQNPFPLHYEEFKFTNKGHPQVTLTEDTYHLARRIKVRKVDDMVSFVPCSLKNELVSKSYALHSAEEEKLEEMLSFKYK